MVTRLTDPDLQALDEIWPIGRQLRIPDGGTVIIAGAYKGRYMHYIAEVYPKTKLILGFEPQIDAADEAHSRTLRYSNCWVMPCALGVSTIRKRMGKYGTDGCSFACSDSPTKIVSMVEFNRALRSYGAHRIDCFICNMEGYEYELIPHIFKNHLDNHIKSMAIQFHPSGLPREEFVHNMVDQHYAKKIDSPGWEYWFNP